KALLLHARLQAATVDDLIFSVALTGSSCARARRSSARPLPSYRTDHMFSRDGGQLGSPMSALAPIATELTHRNETPLCAPKRTYAEADICSAAKSAARFLGRSQNATIAICAFCSFKPHGSY